MTRLIKNNNKVKVSHKKNKVEHILSSIWEHIILIGLLLLGFSIAILFTLLLGAIGVI